MVQAVIQGPLWGTGKAEGLDVGMHWWEVRNVCVCSARDLNEFSKCVTSGLCVTGNQSWNFLFLHFEGLGHSFWGWLACLLSWDCWLWPSPNYFLRKFWSLVQHLLVSGSHTTHYIMILSRYLWKLLVSLHFSVCRSCGQPVAMRWVCYPHN